MKFLSIILLMLVFGITSSIAQKVELCQGAYFTEQQGADFLASEKFQSLSDWKIKAAGIKSQILKGMDLEKIPTRPNSKPIIHGKMQMDGYTIEKVFIETLPGFYMTGNLYRPTLKMESYAGILCPHGHGLNPSGRFMEQTQKRCGTLARMGAVVFVWDIIGQGDSQQCEHTMAKALKLQTINSIRALDFLESLPNVDKNRIAMTGESGGGTQTFILTALDQRVKVAVPAVMVSSYFFGGCVCESGMPIHKQGDFQTNNVQIAALTAPRPMLLISDGGDWTKNTPAVEYPYIKSIYNLYGASENVKNVHLPNEEHDYGPNKRIAMYEFLALQLDLDITSVTDSEGEIDESQVPVLTEKQLSVFDEKHPLPKNAVKGNEAVLGLL